MNKSLIRNVMIFIGFLKEEDKNIKSAMNFKEMFMDFAYEEDLRLNINKYLEAGYAFAGTMSYIYDNDGMSIGANVYKTDGNYIWPNYYQHYLKKYDNFFVSKLFIEYLKEIKFKMPEVKEKDLINIDKIFTEDWSIKKNRTSKKAQKSFFPKFKP